MDIMKPKLNLKDRTADWCCISHPELIAWVSERDEIEYSGNLDYYGQFSGKINGGDAQFGIEYTPAEFAEALAELNRFAKWDKDTKGSDVTLSDDSLTTELTAPEWQPKCGDMVDVSDDGVLWELRELIGTHPSKERIYRIITADGNNILSFSLMRQPKPRPTITVTIDGIAKPITDFTEAQLIELYKSAKL